MNNKSLNTKLIDTLFAHVNDVFYIRDANTEGYPLLYVNDAYHTVWNKTTKSLFKNQLDMDVLNDSGNLNIFYQNPIQ